MKFHRVEGYGFYIIPDGNLESSYEGLQPLLPSDFSRLIFGVARGSAGSPSACVHHGYIYPRMQRSPSPGFVLGIRRSLAHLTSTVIAAEGIIFDKALSLRLCFAGSAFECCTGENNHAL